ncbi:MAG: TetR family transcriptional regulator [Salinarimonas sp.]|nr:TetR family transcriptional regulator [Salinarimonas sp.]
MPSRATTPRPDRGAWRKTEIIEAAAQCFMERGYHATGVDDVARRLGCTKGRIYHHYASKTDLFFAVHREGMARLFAAQEAILPLPENALEALCAMLTAHANAMLEHHTYESVVAQGVQVHRFEATTPDQRDTMAALIAERDRFEALFKARLARGMAQGSIRESDVSITGKVLLGALQWSIIWYRPRPDDDAAHRADLAARMVAPLIEGLRPPG